MLQGLCEFFHIRQSIINAERRARRRLDAQFLHERHTAMMPDADGDILLISQFTLFAQTKKGNRPGFTRAARPDKAIPMYEQMIKTLEGLTGKKVATGVFGADMKIGLVNDGPVTIVMDTKDKDNH